VATPFSSWSETRLNKVKTDWQMVTYWFSGMGMVYQDETGDWWGKAQVVRNGKSQLGRINDTFGSAEAAMGAVERVWKREEERRNKLCKMK
jgi:hypothetical protein